VIDLSPKQVARAVRRLLVLLWPLAALSSCAHSAPTTPRTTGSLSITTDRDLYYVGDTIRVTFQNVGSIRLDYNPCPRYLERREGSHWVFEGYTDDFSPRVECDLVRIILRPGEKRLVGIWGLPRAAPSDTTYRVRFVNLAGVALPSSQMVSNTFRIW
jgi:hypothetical protein